MHTCQHAATLGAMIGHSTELQDALAAPARDRQEAHRCHISTEVA